MTDGTLRLNDDQEKCLVTMQSRDTEAKRNKQQDHPYTARDLVIGSCTDVPDKQKLWQTYDKDGGIDSIGQGCMIRQLEEVEYADTDGQQLWL